MADINLLQNTQASRPSSSDQVIRFLNAIGITVLIVVVIASGLVYYEQSILQKQIITQQKNIADVESQIQTNKDYPTLLKDQNKIRAIRAVIGQHLDWSKLLPDLFNATLKTASFTSLSANKDGSANIAGEVPNFQELDKLIQGFQLSPFDQYIKDVQLVNIGETGSSATSKGGVGFTIVVTFNNNLLNASGSGSGVTQ